MKFLIMLVVLLCTPAFAEESDDTLLGRCVAATAVAGNTGAALYILHNMTTAQRRAVKHYMPLYESILAQDNWTLSNMTDTAVICFQEYFDRSKS